MNPTPTITASDLEACLAGHADGVRARVVAMLVLKGGLDFRMAMRRFNIPKSTLSAAKSALESEIYRTARRREIAAFSSGISMDCAAPKGFMEQEKTSPDLTRKLNA